MQPRSQPSVIIAALCFRARVVYHVRVGAGPSANKEARIQPRRDHPGITLIASNAFPLPPQKQSGRGAQEPHHARRCQVITIQLYLSAILLDGLIANAAFRW